MWVAAADAADATTEAWMTVAEEPRELRLFADHAGGI